MTKTLLQEGAQPSPVALETLLVTVETQPDPTGEQPDRVETIVAHVVFVSVIVQDNRGAKFAHGYEIGITDQKLEKGADLLNSDLCAAAVNASSIVVPAFIRAVQGES